MADAKSAWLDTVDSHKKKQKGLPALSTLKTDVGPRDVTDCMFNNSTSDASSAVVDGGSFGESVTRKSLDDKNVSVLNKKAVQTESLDDGFDMFLRTWL